MCIRDSLYAERYAVYYRHKRDVNGIEARIGTCLYVDNTALFYLALSTAMIKYKMQRAVNKIIENAENMGFCFSLVKTTCIHFCLKKYMPESISEYKQR